MGEGLEEGSRGAPLPLARRLRGMLGARKFGDGRGRFSIPEDSRVGTGVKD